MNFKKNFLIFFVTCLCCFLGSGNLFGQDLITKKDGKKLTVIIKEVSDTEVKYVDYRDVEGVVFVMDRALIREIKFSYGKKIKEEGPSQEVGYYLDDRNQNIKFNFTAIASNTTILTYERSIDPTSSMEYSIRIPGVGVNQNFRDDLSGIGFAIGYKLKVGSAFKKDGYRPKHLMEGSYFRLVAGFLYTQENESFGTNGVRRNSSVHGGIEFGKQWVVSNRVAFDLYGGFHYFGGSSSFKSNGATFDDFDRRELIGGDLFGSGSIAGSFGFRIGYLFGNYGNAVKNKKKKKR